MADRFLPEDTREFESDAKIALIATVSPAGLPHLTLITTLQAKNPGQLIWGQFCEGLSKVHVKTNSCTAFLIMNQKRELWRGKARWTHLAREGREYELYNRKPMFRYNSYFGVHTVHYMDLVDTSTKETLSPPAIAAGYAMTSVTRRLVRKEIRGPILKPWAKDLLNRVSTLKFLSYVAGDGFPRIIPVVPCQAVTGGQLIFVPTVYKAELASIPAHAAVAMFAINLELESILVRGSFAGYRRSLCTKAGLININWVYNSMPPKAGQIHPREPLSAATSF